MEFFIDVAVSILYDNTTSTLNETLGRLFGVW